MTDQPENAGIDVEVSIDDLLAALGRRIGELEVALATAHATNAALAARLEATAHD